MDLSAMPFSGRLPASLFAGSLYNSPESVAILRSDPSRTKSCSERHAKVKYFCDLPEILIQPEREYLAKKPAIVWKSGT
jgi:hypothetical protein